MSSILVLSAHDTQIDRRIAAEANALVGSGRQVTLLSVPTRLAAQGLDPRVRLIVEEAGEFESPSCARSIARRLPAGLGAIAQSLWYAFGSGPLPYNTSYFLRNAPGDESFDAIHCHDLKTLPAGVELRKTRWPGAKLVYDAHEFFPFQSRNRAFQRYWTRIERAAIAETDLAITVNPSIAQAMANLYGAALPKVLYNGCAERRGAPASDEEFARHFGSLSPTGRKAVFQGNLSADRNLENLVLAFASLEGRASLFLLGEGERKESLRSLCRRKRIANVFFGSWTEPARMMAFLAGADLGVIPYRGDRLLNSLYTTPNKLFEYIEAGIPVCASDLPELRRIVRGRGIGEVYPMRTAREIADAVRDCLSRLERGEFAPQSLAKAREEFAWDKQEANLVRWYEEMGV